MEENKQENEEFNEIMDDSEEFETKQILDETISSEDKILDNLDEGQENKIKLPENLNWNDVLIWGVSGFIFAVILIFLVSLIAGTLGFILGRIVIFGIIFFILGGGIRILIEIFSPELLNIENKKSSDLSVDSDAELSFNSNKNVGSNIDTAIDDQIITDPLWSEEEKEENGNLTDKVSDKLHKKKKLPNDDYIEIDGTDVAIPNDAGLMAESIRTMMKRDEDD